MIPLMVHVTGWSKHYLIDTCIICLYHLKEIKSAELLYYVGKAEKTKHSCEFYSIREIQISDIVTLWGTNVCEFRGSPLPMNFLILKLILMFKAHTFCKSKSLINV
jgi:hypothetical protein